MNMFDSNFQILAITYCININCVLITFYLYIYITNCKYVK